MKVNRLSMVLPGVAYIHILKSWTKLSKQIVTLCKFRRKWSETGRTKPKLS